jgi:glycosyltransferase involved in cell wall biosynthesis
MPDVITLQHPANRGVAAAILTGLRAAPSNVVCSIDCDCSYDPAILEQMIPLLDGCDLVTASPYHPKGSTFNVPEWRLFLSRGLSRIYSRLLGIRLYTFTSCCRVYRKDVVEKLRLQHDDFLGVAEILIRARLAGARIVEFPATLEARLFGESKMKTLRTIRRHLGLLFELAVEPRADAAPRATKPEA